MRELQLYGIIPYKWHFDEKERVLHVTTDIANIELKLTLAQVEHLKQEFERQRKYVGREWQGDALCIPAKDRREEP